MPEIAGTRAPRPGHLAVVGGGMAGLAAARESARSGGHRLTIAGPGHVGVDDLTVDGVGLAACISSGQRAAAALSADLDRSQVVSR